MFRSRENKTIAEKELLGSVSASVCEFWDGRGIGMVIFLPWPNYSLIYTTLKVRVSGAPAIAQFVYQIQKGMQLPEISTVYQAYHKGKQNNKGDNSGDNSDYDVFKISTQPPNLTFSGWRSERRSYIFAGIGLLLQSFVIVMSGVITFKMKHLKATRPYSPLTGYILFVAGRIFSRPLIMS